MSQRDERRTIRPRGPGMDPHQERGQAEGKQSGKGERQHGDSDTSSEMEGTLLCCKRPMLTRYWGADCVVTLENSGRPHEVFMRNQRGLVSTGAGAGVGRVRVERA